MEIAYIFVLVGVVCIYLQTILGRFSGRTTSRYVHGTAKLAYLLSNAVGTVAMGFMHGDRSTVVWLMSLVVLNNSLGVSEKGNDVQLLFTVVNIFCVAFQSVHNFNQYSQLSRWSCFYWIEVVMIVIFIIACALCKISISLATDSKDFSTATSQYMQLQEFTGDLYNAQTLEGYHYLVKFELPSSPYGHVPHPCTTLEDIYVPVDPQVDGTELQGGRNVCLSFALFHLLLRQYNGVPCREAEEPGPREKARALVLNHLLPGDQNNNAEIERGFRAIRAELAFLHDHINGGLQVLWSNRVRRCYIGLSVLKSIMYMSSVALYSTTANGISLAVILLVVLHLLLDVLQIILYCTSDRWVVSYMSRHSYPYNQVLQSGLLNGKVISKIDSCVAQVHTSCIGSWLARDYWQNSIGQYSLLDDRYLNDEPNLVMNLIQVFFPNHNIGRANPVELPAHVQRKISQFLIRGVELNDALDGVPSLTSALPSEEVDKVAIILKWHIATWWCANWSELYSIIQPNKDLYETATILSRYCAYLLAFHPDLLPDRAKASHTFGKVHATLNELEFPNHIQRRKLEILIHLADNNDDGDGSDTVKVLLRDGVTIGRILMNMTLDERWRILAKIWVKLIASIAPSPHHSYQKKYAEYHVKCLAEGGEFLTHIWSILSHSCVIEQHPWPQEIVHRDEFMARLFRFNNADGISTINLF